MKDKRPGRNRHRLQVAAVAIAAVAAALTLAACGEKSEDGGGTATQPFSLTLDFYPNRDHAGIYMAQELGYFEEAGLLRHVDPGVVGVGVEVERQAERLLSLLHI